MTEADINELKAELEAKVLPSLMGMPGVQWTDAKSMFENLFEIALKGAREDGSLDLPVDMGDRMLAIENHDATIRAKLQRVRAEGGTDDDIRRWWNSHDVERRLMVAQDDVFKITVMLEYTREVGLRNEDAIKRLRRHMPRFAPFNDPKTFDDDDQPLPIELKFRVNDYMCQFAPHELEALREEMYTYSSCNAFLRAKIRNGSL